MCYLVDKYAPWPNSKDSVDGTKSGTSTGYIQDSEMNEVERTLPTVDYLKYDGCRDV